MYDCYRYGHDNAPYGRLVWIFHTQNNSACIICCGLISFLTLLTGVRVSRSSGNVDLFAKKIVSDAGIINTFKKLLPTDVAKKSCECTGVLV